MPRAAILWSCLVGVAAAQGPDDGPQLLRAPNGAPLKLIARRPAALWEEPRPDAPSAPVRAFEFFYAYESEAKVGGYHLVGRSAPRAVPIGWMKVEDVVEWPHRQALAFAPRGDRGRTLFYRSEADLRAAYGLDDAIRPEPLSIEPERTTAPLLPILEEGSFEREQGPLRIFRVAYLAAPPGPTAEVTRRELGLDVAFVIDATGSMQPWIAQSLAAARGIAEQVRELPDLRDRVRFALVCFRDSRTDYQPKDYVPNDDYVVRVSSDFVEGDGNRGLLDKLGAVVAEGGGQAPERTLDGVKTAIQKLTWSAHSYKHLILIGNASAHEGQKLGGGLTVAEVRRLAQPPESFANPERAITIHALQVPSKDKVDQAKARRQLVALTAGERYPGLCEMQTDLETFQDRLEQLIVGRLAVVAAVARGDGPDRIAKAAAEDRLIGPLLPMLGGGADPGGFVAGYVAEEDVAGNRQVEPHVLVRRGQLQRFEASLAALVVAVEASGEPGARDQSALIAEVKRLGAGLQLGEPIGPDTPARLVLRMVLDLPIRGELFDVTPRRLAAMTAEEWAAWKAEVKRCADLLREQAADPRRWFALGRSGPPDQDLSFVRLADLP